MDDYPDAAPPINAQAQHDRLVALRALISSNIPCILWADDAMRFCHAVFTEFIEQQIIVPDELLYHARDVLMKGPYSVNLPMGRYHMYLENGLNLQKKGTSAFPNYVYLRHVDIPEEEPYRLDPLPYAITLLPQSYFGFDVRSSSSFTRLDPGVINIDPRNGGILIPKFHILLEGLVHVILHPPCGFHHFAVQLQYHVYIWSLTKSRVRSGSPDVGSGLRAEEEKIISELGTEESRWYIRNYLVDSKNVREARIDEWKAMNKNRAISTTASGGLQTALGSTSTAYGGSRQFSSLNQHPSHAADNLFGAGPVPNRLSVIRSHPAVYIPLSSTTLLRATRRFK